MPNISRQCYFHKLDDPRCRLPGWIPDYRHNASHDKERGLRIINYDHWLAYDGMVDCQVSCSPDQPANLQLYGAGRILWNKHDNHPDAIRQEMFSLLYGAKTEAVVTYCLHMSNLLQQCGNYHDDLTRTPFKLQQLESGLKLLETELADIGELPKHREKAFRDSLKSLQQTASAIRNAM